MLTEPNRQASEEDTARFLAAAVSTGTEQKGETTIVDEIVRSNLPVEDKTFSRVLADVLTVTGAGFETTASVLRLAVYQIYSNPDILHHLREELATVSSAWYADIELRTLEQLPYLTAVLMEAMRLSPALGTRLQRIAPDRDLIYGEWVIPSGTPVGMTAFFMHMDEKLYPEPKKFDPERWVDPEARKKAEKVYAPFSRGSRICLGMQYVSPGHGSGPDVLSLRSDELPMLTSILVLHGRTCILQYPHLSNESTSTSATCLRTISTS